MTELCYSISASNAACINIFFACSAFLTAFCGEDCVAMIQPRCTCCCLAISLVAVKAICVRGDRSGQTPHIHKHGMAYGVSLCWPILGQNEEMMIPKGNGKCITGERHRKIGGRIHEMA